MTDSIHNLKEQLSQLADLARSGALPQDQVQQARIKLERQLLDAVMAVPLTAPAPLDPSISAADRVAELAVQPSKKLMWGMFAFVVLVGVGGYAWLGNPGAWHTGPNSLTGLEGESAPAASGSAPHEVSNEQIATMAEGLAQRLKNDPDNAEGWTMLARSYAVLGRYQDAIPAYKRLVALRPNDAQAYADYADALGMSQGRNLTGEPSQLVAKALALDPKNFKALSLAGTVAFDKQDYKTAAKLWDMALKFIPAEHADLSQQISAAADDARQRAGLPPAAKSTEPAPSSTAAPAQVVGTVSLSTQLAQQARPEDTVFIVARPAQGPRMPLAVLRKQVKDLPLQFTLDDSLAMSPQMKLSAYSQVVVGARVSKSGQAMPQAGDLEGWSKPVNVGTTGIKIDIKDVVR